MKDLKLVLLIGGLLDGRVTVLRGKTKFYEVPEMGGIDHIYEVKGCEGYYKEKKKEVKVWSVMIVDLNTAANPG